MYGFLFKSKNEAKKDWRMKHIIAKNIGDYALLFGMNEVKSSLVPIFFKFCNEQVVKIRKSASKNFSSILKCFDGDKQY
jgi:hypothetical protein